MAGSTERAWYSVAEVAQLLGVSRTTVWRWIRAGRLPARRVGPRTLRVERSAVEARGEPADESRWMTHAEHAALAAERTFTSGSRPEEPATDMPALRARRASAQERKAVFANHDPERAREILSRTMGRCPDMDDEAIIAYIYRGRDEGSRA